MAPPASRYQESTRLDSFNFSPCCFRPPRVTSLRVRRFPGPTRLRPQGKHSPGLHAWKWQAPAFGGVGVGQACSVRWSTPRPAADSCRRSCLRPVAWHVRGAETGIKWTCPELCREVGPRPGPGIGLGTSGLDSIRPLCALQTQAISCGRVGLLFL